MPDKIKTMNLFLQLRCVSFQGKKKKKWNIRTVFYDFYFIILEYSDEDLGNLHVTFLIKPQ